MIRDVLEAAHAKGKQLPILNAGTEGEIDAAFASLVQLHAGALLVGTSPLFVNQCERLVALAARNAIPAVYEAREFAEAGGLISYGPSLPAATARPAFMPEGFSRALSPLIYPPCNRRRLSWSST